MPLDERTRLARLAYIRAVALVRSNPSPEAWVRLRAAARDLHQATAGRSPPTLAPPARHVARAAEEARRGGPEGPG